MEQTEAKQAVQELTMTQLYLTRSREREPLTKTKYSFAWKGYDFSVLDRLKAEDYIRQGGHPSKSKRVYLTDSGEEYARLLLKKYGIAD